MSKILAICGRKKSGKTTLCNFLHGYQLKSYKIIEDFDLTDKGKLVIKAKGEGGEEIHGMVDIVRRDEEFASWAAYNVWPFVKQYSFAHTLKEMCVGLFNIPYENVFGTDDEKNQPIEHIRWENMPGVITPSQAEGIAKTIRKTVTLKNITPEEQARLTHVPFRDSIGPEHNLSMMFSGGGFIVHEPGPMTGREFLQFLGTNVMRKIYGDIWVKNTLGEIQEEESNLSLIDDGRFDNEIEAVQAAGGKAILLLRVDSEDSHDSENGFVNAKFDAVLDARNMSMKEMCEELIKIIEGWGWMPEVFEAPNQ